VLYVGSVTLPGDKQVDWQYGRATHDVLDADWSQRAAALAALGNPVRLTLLREICIRLVIRFQSAIGVHDLGRWRMRRFGRRANAQAVVGL
jgi:hypothetical protein